MTPADLDALTARLCLPPEAVSFLERHGLLERLDLDDAEIRERLWRGHLAFVRREELGRAGDEH